jgi:DinB superfamily
VTPSDRRKLIARYARGPALLERALKRVPPAARKWRPGRGKWSAHEIVCHCADSEANGAIRLRFVLGERNPTLYAYDQDHWAVAFQYHRLPPAKALDVVKAVRAFTTELIRRVPTAEWKRAGTHSVSGRYSAETWLTVYAEHLEKHSRQILRNVKAWKAKARKTK